MGKCWEAISWHQQPRILVPELTEWIGEHLQRLLCNDWTMRYVRKLTLRGAMAVVVLSFMLGDVVKAMRGL